MNRLYSRAGAFALSSALCLITVGRLSAQTTAAPAAAKPAEEDAIVLSPFVVSASDTQDGYGVKDTLGGTRVRTNMSDVASSISVVPKKLLEDSGITNAQQLLVYTTNTEVAGLNGNFSGVSSRGSGVQGNAEAGRLANPNAINRARGLTAMDNTRNYFLSDIPWDSFNIDRIDISRGPNSFLFGVGSPSGISNNSTNEGVFQNKGSIEARFGSYGTTRESLDVNRVLLPKELAIRIDALNDDTQYRQQPAYNHSKRVYGALRYDPKFLSTDSANTTIKINAEAGRVRSNNPRELPPLDFISGYFDGKVNKAGYDPFVYAGTAANTLGNPPGLSPWINVNDIHYIWPGPAAAFWYDATTGALVDSRTTLNGGNGSGTKTLPSGYLSSLPQTFAMYTSGYTDYARAINLGQSNQFSDTTLFKGAAAGTVVYGNKTLSDPSIFNFYNNLIDGPNKQEWQNWHSYNAVIDQTFFNRRLAFQATYDHQDFDYGNQGLMSGGMAPFISVDLDSYRIKLPGPMAGSEVNPNEGRPFMASDSSGSNGSTHNIRDNVQFLANGEINASDFLDANSTAAKIIGTHSFTALAGRYRVDTETRTWSLFATDVPFANAMGDANGLISSQRGISWVTYLGGSLASKTSASGLNLSNIANTIEPTSGTTQTFNNTWNAPSSIDPNAPWTNPANPTGTFYQRDNPANFVGWTNIPVTVLNSKDNLSDLYQSGNKATEKLESESFMYQGTMFDGMVMPMAGYRSDKVRQSATAAPLDPHTSVASMNYSNTGIADVQTTTSKSYGVTLHLPKSMRGNLPLGSDLSLHYFHGDNGTPKIRYGFDATQLPNEAGKTDDISVTLDAFKGKVSIRATYFKTLDKNAAATAGAGDPLGGNGYYLYLLPAWGAADAAATGLYVADPSNNGGSFTQVSGTSSATPLQIAAVADWKANFGKTFTQSFFDAYGLGTNVNAITSGNYAQVMGPGKYYPWDIANTGGGHVNGTWPIISQDVESKGWEIESTLRPVNNWDITFNVSKVNAVQTALGQSTVDFILKQKAFWDGPAGLLPLWGYWGGAHSDANSLRYSFYQNIYSAYLLQTAQTGTAQPELRNWSAKGITNYTFTNGSLKGFNVGGGVRWSSKPILGYGISLVTDQLGNKQWLQDVNKPLRGTIDEHCDLWVGYERKISSKLTWRIQLNVQNVMEKARLAPVSLEPDGSVAQSRITQGQVWSLTNTLKF